MSEASLGRGDDAGRTRVEFERGAQGATKGFENRFALVVGVHAFEVVDVQRHTRVVDKALEELKHQLGVERANHAGGEVHVHVQTWAAREVDHHAAERFIQRHISVAIAANAFFVAHGLGNGLAQGDADVFDRVVAIDVQVALALHIQVDEAVSSDLVQHVVQKTNPGGQFGLARAVKIEGDADVRLGRFSGDFGLAHGAFHKEVFRGGMIPFHPCGALVQAARSGASRHTDGFLMSQYWSAVVHGLTPYIPGEQPKITNLIKLNTNEHPWGPSPRALDAIRSATHDSLRLYPDPNADALKAALARHHDVSANQVFVGNGSDEVLAHAFMALLNRPGGLWFPDITYSFYPVYCGLYDMDYRTVPLAEDFTICVDDYLPRDGQAAGAIIFPNPNAPTGCPLSLAEVERIVAGNPQAVVLVDEAYVDFGAESAVGLVKRYPNLLVCHTFSKSRSLAGLRVGYAVGSAELIDGLERVKNSFNSYPLDRLALAGAVASVEDDAYFRDSCAKVIATREQLVADLKDLGFEVLPSAANFVFARHHTHAGAALASGLRERAILVRHFKQARIDNFLRITVGTPEQCAALVDALKTLVT